MKLVRLCLLWLVVGTEFEQRVFKRMEDALMMHGNERRFLQVQFNYVLSGEFKA